MEKLNAQGKISVKGPWDPMDPHLVPRFQKPLPISFSLVPAALWPSVPKVIDGKILGSAYALIFWVQNIGLCFVPKIIGNVLNSTNPGVAEARNQAMMQGTAMPAYDYTVPMIIFASFGMAAFLLGIWLKAEDKRKGYGLDLPNVKK